MPSFPRLAAIAALLLSPLAVQAQALTVSAAASLTDAFKVLAPQFEASRPGVTVRLNFAASGALLQQIRQGAPVDVFASADQETMDRAAAENLVAASTRRNFAGNTLVLVGPAQGGVALEGPQDLRGASVRKIAIGKPATVPAGRYTRQALESAGLSAMLAPRLVQADSVRQVLDYVARGEVEAGFVYRTDASLMADKVRLVATVGGHAPVSYPVAVVHASRQQALARDFVAFLGSGDAQQVMAQFGFAKP